jgi:hypothetical protein
MKEYTKLILKNVEKITKNHLYVSSLKFSLLGFISVSQFGIDFWT